MPNSSLRIQFISVLSLVLSSLSAIPQGTILIGPSTRNGSFEDGVATPWRGALVAQDPRFASAGSWYGVFPETANGTTARAVASQIGLNASPANGLTFILTFDARNGALGFDSVYGYINALNADGSSALPSRTPVTSPPLGSNAWGEYQTLFQFPQTWDGGGNFLLGIQFTRYGAVVGITYTGYLDNVILRQIP